MDPREVHPKDWEPKEPHKGKEITPREEVPREENWTIIDGYEKYEVSDMGNVRLARKPGELLRQFMDKAGRPYVKLRNRTGLNRVFVSAIVPDEEKPPTLPEGEVLRRKSHK